MTDFNDFELNEHYKTIRDLSYEVTVKTYANNKGVMSLVDNLSKKPIYSVDIKTNGRGTSRIMHLLPTVRPLTHLDLALSSLAKFAEDYDATIVRRLSLPSRRLHTKTFTSVFNQAIREHKEVAYNKVLEHLSENPKASFSTLVAEFCYDLISHIKTKEQS